MAARPVQRRPRFFRGPAWVLPALLGLVGALTACAGQGLAPAGGGLPADEAARISLAVAQTRAQFPDVSAGEMPFQARPTPPPGEKPGLVLRGLGVGVRPGIQTGARSGAEVALFLAKPGYNAGWVRISIDGGPRERWPIVAYDHRGKPQQAFEFQFVLVPPSGGVRYLAVIGGPFPAEGGQFFGLEGTLIEPGGPETPGGWRRAFKIDFGFRFPRPPEHAALLEEADRIFRELPRQLATIADVSKNLEQARGEAPAAPAPAGGRVAELERLFAEHRERLKKDLLSYYRLRERIAESYAAFAESNFYTWLPLERQQAYFDDWRRQTRHHPRIDDLTARARAYLETPAVLDAARTEAMGQVRRYANDRRNPAKPLPPLP